MSRIIAEGVIIDTFPVARTVTEVRALLRPEDLEHTTRMSERRARQSVTAVARLRELVAREHGQRDAADTITRICARCGAAHGRPRFAHVPIDFSLSHSADRVAISITRHGTVGIDIEALTPRRTLPMVDEEGPADTLTGFYRRWTRREALVKTGRDPTDAEVLCTFTLEGRYLVSVAHSRPPSPPPPPPLPARTIEG